MDMSVEDCFRAPISPRLVREPLDLPLLPDLTEAASTESPLEKAVEFLGLSTLLLLPGILDRREQQQG